MSEFEITHKEPPREKIYSIEKSDQDYMIGAGLVYRKPNLKNIDPESPLGKKLELALKVCENTQVINLTPIDQEDIRQETKNAKSKSETVKKQPRKVPSKRNKSAMA